MALAAGRAEPLRFDLTDRQRDLLRTGGDVEARIAVQVADRAGNSAALRRTTACPSGR